MLSKDDKAGLYLTIIVHLVILIILLIAQIGYSLKREDTFVIDFSKQEMLEEKKAQETFEKDIDKKIDDLVSSKIAKMLDGTSGVDFKNVTSSRNNSTRRATAVRQCSRGISTAERPAIFPSLHTDATAEEW